MPTRFLARIVVSARLHTQMDNLFVGQVALLNLTSTAFYATIFS